MEEGDLQSIWDVIGARLQQYRPRNIYGENGEVLLRHSLQMCQWVSLLEPFVPGADVLLEALIQVSHALAFEVEQSNHRRRGRPCFPISEEQRSAQRAQGIIVQRHRIRDTLHVVDPQGVHNRLRGILHRRQYNVPSLNALWHVDGYHKLIRRKIIVRGGIDGFSRVVTHLRAATNNTSQTAFSAFLEGVAFYGLPSHVRTDQGGENTLIVDCMVRQRGSGRGSIIMGRSVHNQRIERLWRDLFSGCVSYFYNLFYHLEAEDLLDPENEADILALHMTFLPKLQKSLTLFNKDGAIIVSEQSTTYPPINCGCRECYSRRLTVT